MFAVAKTLSCGVGSDVVATYLEWKGTASGSSIYDQGIQDCEVWEEIGGTGGSLSSKVCDGCE